MLITLFQSAKKIAVQAITGCFVFGLLVGCMGEKPAPGVVATVNERPIMLDDVEAMYDIAMPVWATSLHPTTASLGKEYGSVLMHLVVQELVMQELEKRGLAITDAELLQAEKDIQSDYGEAGHAQEQFEQSLIEDGIVIEQWRSMLKRRLSLARFSEQLLRPQVHIDAQAVEQYYATHTEQFLLPERVRLVVVESDSKKTLEEARLYLADATNPLSNNAASNRYDVLLDEERLPEQWKQALEGVLVGESSPVHYYDNTYFVVALQERLPQRQQSIAEAYPQIEAYLMEERLDALFAAWCDNALEHAVIRVASQLVPSNPQDAAEENREEAQRKDAEHSVMATENVGDANQEDYNLQ